MHAITQGAHLKMSQAQCMYLSLVELRSQGMGESEMELFLSLMKMLNVGKGFGKQSLPLQEPLRVHAECHLRVEESTVARHMFWRLNGHSAYFDLRFNISAVFILSPQCIKKA